MESPHSVIKILEICRVKPAPSSTHNIDSADEFVLPLTYFDITWLKFPPAECLYFFKLNDSGSTPSFFHSTIFPTLKHSLAQTLIHYLPLAGHLTWPSNSSKPLIIYSPNDSLSLTLAQSNEDFDHFVNNEIREATKSHPYIPKLVVYSTNIASLLALQITFFPHKGFSIGVAIHKAMFDGKSISMFMNAWAYICKRYQQGEALCLLPEPLNPFLDRTVIKDIAGLESAYLNQWAATVIPGSESNPRSLEWLQKLTPPPNMVRATFRLSRDDIKKLKESVLVYNQTRSKSNTQHLSTYVLVCAYVFVCLVKARGGDGGRKVYLVWSADCRGRIPQIPQNYFGNCVLVNHLEAEAGELMEENNGVAIIAEKLTCLINGLDQNGLLSGAKERLVMLRSLPAEVQKFGVAGATRLGFYGLDFGWGSVVKAEITSVDRTGGFSIMEDGGEGIEIGIVLKRTEMEPFAFLFANGLKIPQSRL